MSIGHNHEYAGGDFMDKIIVPADKLAKAVIEHLLPAAIRIAEKRHAEIKNLNYSVGQN